MSSRSRKVSPRKQSWRTYRIRARPWVFGRVAGHGGVNEEAAVLGVLEEAPVILARVAIGTRDDGLEIVDHEPADHVLKEGPRHLQPREDRRQVLAERDPQEGVSAEGQRDEESVHRPVGTGGGIRPHAQPPEVGFGGLAGRRIGHPHGHVRRAGTAVGLSGGWGKGFENPWGKGFENQPVSWRKPSGKSHASSGIRSATARAVARPPGPIRPGENIALRPPRTFLVPEVSSGRSPSPRVGYCYTAPGGGHRDRTFTHWSTAVTGCTFWRRTGPRPVRSFLRRKNDGRGISGVRRDA